MKFCRDSESLRFVIQLYIYFDKCGKLKGFSSIRQDVTKIMEQSAELEKKNTYYLSYNNKKFLLMTEIVILYLPNSFTIPRYNCCHSRFAYPSPNSLFHSPPRETSFHMLQFERKC